MNIRLLRRIQKAILKYPDNFNMSVWGDLHDHGTSKPSCGTCGCIAGWACFLSGINIDIISSRTVISKAQYLLKISREQNWILFLAEEFANKNGRLSNVSARKAVSFIDNFIASKGVTIYPLKNQKVK